MAEVQIKVEIQDGNGSIRKRVTLAVPDTITKSELAAGIKSHFGEVVGEEKLEILVDAPENRPLATKLFVDGARIIVRPKPSASFFRVINEE
ncbi:MAG: hypothetical protein ACOYZ8_11235 [Chloroflexota bacterium]